MKRILKNLGINKRATTYVTDIIFSTVLFTGVHNATMQEQLEGFSFALKKTINSPVDNAVSKK